MSTTTVRTDEPPVREKRSPLVVATIAVVAVFGLWIRWTLLKHSSLQPDSDESMSGLMAMDLLEGEFNAFLWGQPFGGAAEVIPVAVMIELFGANLFAMRALTIGLGAVAPFLVWRVATRYMRPAGAVAAGLTMWIWPVALISWSMREYLYYEPVLNLGLLGILLAQRSTENPKNRLQLVGTGICMGLGWWMSPFVAYFGIFVVLVLVFGNHRRGDRLAPAMMLVRRGWLSLIGFCIGAAPWLSFNIPREFASLSTPAGATGGSYLSHLDYFLHPGLSVAMGLKGWYSKAWPFDLQVLGHAMFFAGVGVAAFVIVRASLRFVRRGERLPIDLICLVLWPFLYATSPMTGSDELWVPRYFFFLWPFMAFVIGRLVETRKTLPVVMSLVLALSLLGLRDQTMRVNDWPYTGELREQVAANGVTHMFTSFWVAYKITYETEERVIATPAFPPSVRYRPYDEFVRRSEQPAWAFRAGDQRERRFVDATRGLGMDLQPIPAGAYNLYLPDRLLLPEELPRDVLIDPVEGV